MLNLTNGGSRIAWNTSGLMYGIHLDINNVASGAGSCAMRIAGAPVFFDMTNGSDGPRAQALTVRARRTATLIPGSDPGDQGLLADLPLHCFVPGDLHDA